MVKVALAVLALVLVAACSAEEIDQTGDCNARLGYAGAVFRPHNEVDQALPAGELLGEARVVDCDGTELDERVPVHAVVGFDPTLTLAVVGGDHRGVYVRDGLAEADWPPGLRRTSARPAR